ncbi:MAG: serine protease [Firmicutes bacterium]|nr:serine protease [Bacillota bacterium]
MKIRKIIATLAAALFCAGILAACGNVAIKYTLTVNGGTGGGTFDAGAQVTVTATPRLGKEFVAWLEGDTQVSTANPYTFALTKNTTLTAKFQDGNFTKAGNLMDGVSPQTVNAIGLDADFINSTASLSVDLFQRAFADKESMGKNVMVSPTSILLALAMTANGANANTLAQMERVLGGGISINQLNRYLYSFVKGLDSQEKSRLEIANSIWFREGVFNVNPDFLQVNADYYGADAYAAAFDNTTVEDINNWCDVNTDGMIKEILDDIPEEAIMYLINAVMFDAEWARIYEENDVRSGQFNAFDGAVQTVEFMRSEESRFIQDVGAKGFIKPYYDNKYSFAALLPDEDILIDDYVASLTGERFANILSNKQTASVLASMPKFEFDFSIGLNDILKSMGMPDAFDPFAADFSKTGTAWGNIFISKVQHKTFISVDERGTRAGAVTSVEDSTESEPSYRHYITLDRPFVFAIIDNATNLPIFMGTVLSI